MRNEWLICNRLLAAGLISLAALCSSCDATLSDRPNSVRITISEEDRAKFEWEPEVDMVFTEEQVVVPPIRVEGRGQVRMCVDRHHIYICAAEHGDVFIYNADSGGLLRKVDIKGLSIRSFKDMDAVDGVLYLLTLRKLYILSDRGVSSLSNVKMLSRIRVTPDRIYGIHFRAGNAGYVLVVMDREYKQIHSMELPYLNKLIHFLSRGHVDLSVSDEAIFINDICSNGYYEYRIDENSISNPVRRVWYDTPELNYREEVNRRNDKLFRHGVTLRRSIAGVATSDIFLDGTYYGVIYSYIGHRDIIVAIRGGARKLLGFSMMNDAMPRDYGMRNSSAGLELFVLCRDSAGWQVIKYRSLIDSPS